MKSGIIYGSPSHTTFTGINYKMEWETAPDENGGNFSIVTLRFYLTCPHGGYASFASTMTGYFAYKTKYTNDYSYSLVNDNKFNANFNITDWFDDGKYSVYKKFQFYNTINVRGENIIGVEQFVGEIKYTQYHNFNGTWSYEDGNSSVFCAVIQSQTTSDNRLQDFGGNFDLKGVEFEPINRGIKVNTAPNFNDEDNPTITYINDKVYVTSIQAGISLDGNTLVIPYREMALDGNTYTFNLTDAERQALRDNTANKNVLPVYFMMKTKRTYNKVVYEWVTKLERTLTIVDCMPQLNPTVEDVSETTLFLTGDKNVFVRYHSKASYVINATASKGATINYQQISNGSKKSTTPSGILEGIETEKFLFTATDTRDNITSLLVEKPFIPYIKLTCNVKLLSATPDGVIKFRINGNYFNDTFGKENNFLSLKYRFKEESGNYGDWVTVNPTVTSNTYSIDITISNLYYLKTYIFDVEARDYLNIITNANNEFRFLPVFDWSKEDFNFNVPISYTEGKTSYSISDAAKQVFAADMETSDFTKLKGLINAMTKRYELTCEVGESIYYDSATVTLYLYGNVVRGYMTATRKESIAAGNLANELVCQVEFDSGGKITGFGQVAFTSGTEGGLANFQMTETLIQPDDGSISPESVGKGRFNIVLCSTGTGGNKFNAYFTFPCLLDLTKFD